MDNIFTIIRSGLAAFKLARAERKAAKVAEMASAPLPVVVVKEDIAEVPVAPQHPKPSKYVDASDPEKISYACFKHTKRRVWERYNGLVLDYSIWSAWNQAIRTSDPVVIFLEDSNGGSIWRVWFGTTVIYVAFQDGLVRTALPPRPYFARLAGAAVSKRAAKKKQDEQKKPIRYSPIRATLPRLPPVNQRPKRNEAVLAKFRTNSENRDEYG